MNEAKKARTVIVDSAEKARLFCDKYCADRSCVKCVLNAKWKLQPKHLKNRIESRDFKGKGPPSFWGRRPGGKRLAEEEEGRGKES